MIICLPVHKHRFRVDEELHCNTFKAPRKGCVNIGLDLGKIAQPAYMYGRN